MKCLLDTHTFLWAENESPRLSHAAREIIEDSTNDLFVSIASLWEIAIKVSVGKLGLDLPFLDLVVQKPSSRGIEILPITPVDLDVVSQLPFHHRDPFDRLLVAQCLAEQMAIVSNDTVLDSYGVERLW